MLTMWIIVAPQIYNRNLYCRKSNLCLVHIWSSCQCAVAWLKIQAIWQYIAFFVVSIASMLIIRPMAHNYLRGNIVPTNYDRLIGQNATLSKEITSNSWGEIDTGGTKWSCASLDNHPIPEGTNVRIVAIEGAKLIVKE